MATDDELLPRVASIMSNAGLGSHRDLTERLRLGSLYLCETCLISAVNGTYSRCFPCNKSVPKPVPNVYFLTISGATQQSIADMSNYKSESPSEDAVTRLRLLLYYAFKYHLDCIAGDGGGFDVITYVPSGRSDRTSLRKLIPLHRTIPIVDMEYKQPYRTGRAERYAPEKLIADRAIFEGKKVLLIEDSWVKGFNAMSAAKALHLSGASSVKVLVIARRFGEGYSGQDAVLKAIDPEASYDYRFCPVSLSGHE